MAITSTLTKLSSLKTVTIMATQIRTDMNRRSGPSESLAEGKQPKPASDRIAIGSLLALLTVSPCEGFLPVYLTGIKYGWFGFIVLSAILAGATLAGMVLFTWVGLIGLERLKLNFFERYEAGILGGLLCLLGILVILFER